MAIKDVLHGLRLRGTFNVDIKLEGDWLKFNRLIGSTDTLLVIAARSGQKAFAEEYRDRVKRNIRTGGKRFGYRQNSPNYLRRKISRGGASTTLVWSGTFLRSVDIIKNTKQTHWGVGIPKGIKRPSYNKGDRNRLQVHEIANILEQGVPPWLEARPVFSDTFKYDMRGKKGLRNYMELSIIKTFGVSGFKIVKI